MTKLRDMRARRLLLARGGSVSVEMALVITILLLLALGGIDFGRLALEQLRVVNAARAGVQYATQDASTMADTSRIAAAVRRDAGDLDEQTLEISSRTFCACAAAAEASCGQPCPDGAAPPYYVEVSVSRDVELFFSYPGVPATVTLDAVSAMRLR